MKVREKKNIIPYLKSRQLTNQYLKAKRFIEDGLYELVDLRKREPKGHNKFYFESLKNTALLVT
jgi:hypothetical protein